MARGLHKLSASFVKSAPVGKHGDGGGLYLVVASETSRNWAFRYMKAGRAREMGLGSAFYVPLSEARSRAAEIRLSIAKGADPLEERLPTRERRKREASKQVTFKSLAEDFMRTNEAGWSNAKHREQWRRSLELFAYPTIGQMPVAEIGVDDVLTILKPIWATKAETARRVRMRVERILSAAIARGLRSPPNPAVWRENLQHLLPTISKARRVKHFAAVPFGEVPALMRALRQRESLAARCLEFTILTAARSAEARGANRSEFDLKKGVWTIPAERMKGRVAHRVPLPARAVEIAQEMAPLAERSGGLIFPGQGTGRPLTDTAAVKVLRSLGRTETLHGFRSTFRDWAAETTHYPNHVVEMALAHSIGSAVEAAYRRGDLFEKRRELMADWGEYCASGAVVPSAE